MKHGYFYKHSCASDIYIDVIRSLAIKPGVWLVKCRVLGVYGNPYYETTSFRVTRETKRNWEIYTPVHESN